MYDVCVTVFICSIDNHYYLLIGIADSSIIHVHVSMALSPQQQQQKMLPTETIVCGIFPRKIIAHAISGYFVC